MTTATKAPTYKNYIDGSWVAASSGKAYGVINPATEETVGHVANSSRDDMRRAIQAARRAFDEGPWSRMRPHDRSRIIRQIADGMAKRKEEIRKVLVEEAGAEYATHSVNLENPIEYMYDYADRAVKYEFERMLPSDVMHLPVGPARLVNHMVYHAPVGVCGLIPTWNFPLFVTIQKVGPALATGCTMVVKPSPYAPIINLLLAQIVQETDLPAGVFNVVCGEGPEISQELTESALIDKVSFTGSVATGKKIMEAASRTLKRVHLELGGKSPNILLDDINFDMVAPGVASPTYFHAGQGCVMNTRVLVPKKSHDALVAKMAGFVKTVKIGNPADPQVLLGPLIREERRLKVEEYIASGKEQGAELAAGGGRPPGLERGFFLQPTIFANVRNEMRIAQEEIFGPVLSVIPYKDEEEALRIANDTRYGLGATILTGNVPKAMEMAKRLRAGTVTINMGGPPRHTPFGGFKESGIGREGGMYGLDEYTEIMAIQWG